MIDGRVKGRQARKTVSNGLIAAYGNDCKTVSTARPGKRSIICSGLERFSPKVASIDDGGLGAKAKLLGHACISAFPCGTWLAVEIKVGSERRHIWTGVFGPSEGVATRSD